MARLNVKFATFALLAATAIGGAGYGAHWFSTRHSPERFEAKGDRAAQRAAELEKAGEFAKSDAAWIEACNHYGESLTRDLSRTSARDKFRRLTLELRPANAEEASKWMFQHLIACRHEATVAANPEAWRDFYASMLRLASESQNPQLIDRIRAVAGENLAADPKDAAARLWHGVCDVLLVGLLQPSGWELAHPLAKERAAAARELSAEARADLEAVLAADPSQPVAAANLALLGVFDLKAAPEKDRTDAAVQSVLRRIQADLGRARAAAPADAELALAAAKVACVAAPYTGAPPETQVREAVRLALADPAALPPGSARELALLACQGMPAPVAADPDGARTEGQRAAFAVAKAQGGLHQGALQRLTLAEVQSFAGRHTEAIRTLEEALRDSQRLRVADRLAFDRWKPEMLFTLAEAQLDEAALAGGAEGEKLAAGAKDTLERLRLLDQPRLAARILQVEAQELHLAGRHEEAAGRFDRALRLNPGLVSPMVLRTAALCHARCGNLGASADLLEAALRLDPRDAASHRLLALNLLRMGAPEEAIAPHLRLAGGESGLAGDLALRAGRFWEAAEAYGEADLMGSLPKRAEALRASGRGDEAKAEVLAFLRAGKPTAKRALLACRALETRDREPLLAAMRKELGLPEADAAQVRDALSRKMDPEDPTALGATLAPEGREALAAWRKGDFDAFEQAAKKGGEDCLDHPEILSRRIELAFLRRDWDGAGKLADRAKALRLDLPLGSDPAVRASIIAMRALETGSPDLDEAQRQLRRVADESPASTNLWMLLSNLALANGQTAQAIHAAAYACRLQPHRADCRRMLFQARLRAGDAAGALRDLRKAAEEHPFVDDLRELWLSSEETVGDAALAEARRTERMRAAPGDLCNALHLAGLLIRDRKADAARAALLAAAPCATGDPQGAMQVAGALCRAGFADDGRTLLKHLLADRFPPAKVALWAAQFEALAGDPRAEAAAWQAALDLEPSDTRPTSQAYALRLLASGRAKDAAAYLRALAPLVPGGSPLAAGVRGLRFEALLQAGDFDGADALAGEMGERDAAFARGRIAIARGDDAAALECARRAVAQAPGAASAFVALGQALASDPLREQEARAAVRRALELAPANADARHLEAMLDAQAGRYRLAINRLWRNLALNPDHPPSFALLSELLFQEKEDRAALGAAVSGLGAAPTDLGYLRTAAHAALERFRDARLSGYRADANAAANWATGFQSQAFARSASPVDSVALLGTLVEAGRVEEALDFLGRLTQDARRLPPLLAMRALILARGPRPEGAPAAFAEAFRACRDTDEVLECLRLAGEARTAPVAIAMAQEALGADRPPFARLAIGVSAMRWRLPAEVMAELRPLMERADFAGRPAGFRARTLATLAAAENQAEEADGAAAHYREAARLAPGDLVTLNNLADLLLRHPELASTPGEAMAAARRAAFLAARTAAQGRIPRRELAAIRDTLATALATDGRKAEAETIYRSVLEIFPIPESHLHLGRILEKDGRTDEARQHYEKAAALADLSGQRDLAAEARWRHDPSRFASILAYAEALAEIRPAKAREMASAGAALAARETQPAPQLARLMRLCVALWPEPARKPEGLTMARDLAAGAAKADPNSGPRRLLHALALESMGDPAWEAEFDRALSLWGTEAARWRPPMPRALPLPDLATRAAVLRAPPTPWGLPRDSEREIKELLALAPPDGTLHVVANILEMQQEGKHAEAVASIHDSFLRPDGIGRPEKTPGPTLRRLLASSHTALAEWDKAAEALEPLAMSKDGSAQDRLRLLGLFARLGRPEGQTRPLAERLLADDPHCAAAREFLGDLALAGKDDATAAAQYASVSPDELPLVPSVCVKHAKALRALGRPAEADAVLRDGLELCGGDPWVLEAFLDAEPDPGRRREAFEKACGRGLDLDLALAFAARWHLPTRPHAGAAEQAPR